MNGVGRWIPSYLVVVYLVRLLSIIKNQIMPLPTISPPAYLRFIQIVDSIHRMDASLKLDHIEKELLDKLTTAYYNNQFPTIGDFTKMSSLASQATIHNRIKTLIAKGYISLVADDDDSRIKHLVPTKFCLSFYRDLSTAVLKAGIGSSI